MSDAEQIDALVSAIRAGEEPVDLWLVLGEQPLIDLAQQAFHKDVNAALGLLDILLPNYRWALGPESASVVERSPLRPMPVHAKSDHPSRALLLATLIMWHRTLQEKAKQK